MKKSSKELRKKKISKQEEIYQGLEAFLNHVMDPSTDSEVRVYKVAYDHPNDDLGTIKFFDEGLSRQDKLKIIKEQLVRESDFPGNYHGVC